MEFFIVMLQVELKFTVNRIREQGTQQSQIQNTDRTEVSLISETCNVRLMK